MNIKAPTWPLQNATAGIARMANNAWDSIQRLDQSRSGVSRVQSLDRYVSTVSQSLAVFRFLSFALGAGLVFALNPGDQQPLVLGPVVLLVGLFNVYRILWRFDPAQPRLIAQWSSLVVDTGLSISLTLISGGLDSPFLIYSLSPVLTASLLMNLRGALAAASISAISVSGAHVVAGLGLVNLPELLGQNYLVLSLIIPIPWPFSPVVTKPLPSSRTRSTT